MGCFFISNVESPADLNGQNCRVEASSSSVDENDKKTESKNVYDKMIRQLSFILSCRRRELLDESIELFVNDKCSLSDTNIDGSRVLMQETGESLSVHSSFRFSFGSQLELETFTLGSTVLMVNLEKGSKEEVESSERNIQLLRLESLERNISPVAQTITRFSYLEISSATRNFRKDRILGRGALSCVFRGKIRFRTVAIKKLDEEDKECYKAFCRELMIAGSLHHRNIVPLLGFCIDREGLFLVYKYISGGSLEYHLHEKQRKGNNSLSWSGRFKIATGIAKAIAYLHNGTEKCVLHRDIKPSNILLSSGKTPKVCDFGLASWTPAPYVPFLCKTVKGTFGYLAPEYFEHGKVSDKTDIYAFGVVLLELITGRKPIERRDQKGDENLVSWAKSILQRGGDVGQLLDPRLRLTSHQLTQRNRMVRVAAACVNCDEFSRPTINQIISLFHGEEYASGLVEDGYGCGGHDLEFKNDMSGHLALAMQGASDLEGDELYCH